MSYKYITDDNLINIQDYMYSEYRGRTFLEEYMKSRTGFLDANPLGETSEYIDCTNKQLMNIRKQIAKRDFVGVKADLDKYVKRFEVRKRIYSQYDEIGKPNEGSNYTDISNYIVFAECLVSAYVYFQKMKYISCLLKVNDTLISISDTMNSQQKMRLCQLIESELDFIDEIQRRLERCTSNRIDLKNVAMLASDTARTKAYLYEMIREGIVPSHVIVYSDDVGKMVSDADRYENDYGYTEKYCDLRIPVLSYLVKEKIPYILVDNKDINSSVLQNEIKKCNQPYIIYSGYGGFILKPELFQLGKRFIHVHAGVLPAYRGSTTAYYSILQDRQLGASAIFLNEKIDEGEIIFSRVFPLPDAGVDIDYSYEPWIRSQVLVSALKLLERSGGDVHSRPQGSLEEAEIYYIIHPVLKHIAILSLEGV